ncbi:MAG: PilZ domain-containing protein [Novosphingobium sp.]
MARRTGRTRTDKRSAQRFTLLLRVGKLSCDAGEFLCVLRDVSTDGIKAQLFHPLPEASAYSVELGGGERFRIEPIWQRGLHAGFRFADGPIDVHRLLAEAGPFPKRHIRLRLRTPLPAQIEGEGAVHTALVSDISQHGILVEVEPGLALGQEIKVEAHGLPRLHARVRWRRGACYGIVLQGGFRLDELARIAARLQLRESAEPADAALARTA